MNGNLADDPLPTLLHQLFGQKATGILRILNRAGRHDVYLRNGYPVAVVLPGSAELLGKVLFEMGILDEATYKKTLAEPPPSGQRYGDMLLQKGLVTEDQMRLALKAQVRRKLHRLFFLNDGSYEFEAGEHDQGLQKQESLRIHPARAIYHGVRSAWNADRLKGALFLLENRAVKCTLENEGVARYGVGPDDGRVAELLKRGYWTLPDLVEASGLPPQPVHALVYALYITETLDIKSAAEVPRLRKRSDTPLPPNASAPSAESMNTMREISGAYRMPSQVTPLPQKSHSQMSPLPGPTESSGAYKMPSGAFKFPSPPHASSQRVRVPTPPSVTGLDQGPPDVDSVRKQLLAKAGVVETQNLFEVLELPQTATKDEVKQAYFVAAKRYHPDRLVSMGLESLRNDVEKIFRRVSEAYGTLFDDGRRNEYKSTLGKPKEDDAAAHAKAMKMLEADMALRRGEILLKKNDFTGAIRELEQAASLDPQNGEHLAYLTWARVCAGQTAYPDAKNLLNQAIKLSPMCARAYYYLAVCLKEEKDVDRAYNMFRKAHELDSRMLEAEREMRLINMRREKEKGGGGFFDRFRKPHK
ncbi:MAG: tetratricopeptide repeat protein [Myxococcales bacterium]|nr:tetratricopeptide repeat protein [Myxococcales bacterium]